MLIKDSDLTCLSLPVCLQGLRPAVPPASPPLIFASPTKLVSEAGSQAEYLGTNRVPDLQKAFQVMSSAVCLCVCVIDLMNVIQVAGVLEGLIGVFGEVFKDP